MQNNTRIINDLDALRSWCNDLATTLIHGDVIALFGDLGAGKTTVAGFIINALAPQRSPITSPTFNLVHTYAWHDNLIWHFDLYRLKNQLEVYELGWDEALRGGLSIIEWPNIVEDLLPRNTITIKLSFDGENRTLIQSRL